MNDETRKAIINKEIETYRKFATVLESLKSMVCSFEGKCYNKRFTEALEEFLKYGKAESSYHVSTGITDTSYNVFFDIRIHSYDNCVKECSAQDGYSANYYITNDECFLRMKAEETTTKTDGGKYRINAKAIIEKFDEEIRSLNDKVVELENGLNEVDSMRADIEEIKRLMSIFDGKYHRRIKDVFRCNYKLKDDSSIQYR